jgi:hypothetical protein
VVPAAVGEQARGMVGERGPGSTEAGYHRPSILLNPCILDSKFNNNSRWRILISNHATRSRLLSSFYMDITFCSGAGKGWEWWCSSIFGVRAERGGEICWNSEGVGWGDPPVRWR